MALIAKASTNGGFTPAPEGPHSAICIDVIDLGIRETTWEGKAKKEHRMSVAFLIDEMMADDKPFIVRWWGNLTLGEKSNLRKFLEDWRGKKFTADELVDGFDVEKLIGAPALVQVTHTTKGETTYADITSIMKLPKTMAPPKPYAEYVRVKDRPETQPIAQQQRQQDAPPPDETQAEWEDDEAALPF